MNIPKYIPNTITCLNLVSGCMAITMALSSNLYGALLWIIVASVFDFTDGLAARLLHAYSALGKELDSLSDIVSFGVAPGMALLVLLKQASEVIGLTGVPSYLPYFAFVIPVFSGLRLAKFNIDKRQTTSFIGMPVPAHALLWGSLACTLQPYVAIHASTLLYCGILLAVVTSFLLVSELPMFSMKAKSLAWKGNEQRYLLSIFGLLFLLLFKIPGITATILLYILLSLFNKESQNL